jgi:hypothetical protein
VRRQWLGEAKAAIQARTDALIKELKRLCEEKHRPSTALQARTSLLMIKLNRRIATQKPIDPVLQDLQEVVRQGEGLVGYPLEPLIDLLMELSEVVEGEKAYEELFETIIEVASARKGEVAAARMLLKRGEQQLDIDRPYDAIRSLGRAFRGLYKHESRYDVVRALYLCGCAYERVGLLWAGRGTVLRAASLATDELWRYGKVTPLQAACYGRLKWLELQLGRLPHLLAWHEVDCVVRRILADQGYGTARLAGGEQAFDLTLGILLLKTDFWELKRLSTLPDVLERLGLPGASITLIYALGYEEELRDEGLCQAWGDEDLHAIFLKWHNQPALEDLPERPSLYDRQKVTLSSTILGCQITVESENASPCVELAESLLAALESLLSTGAVERMMAREPTLTIAIRKSDFAIHLFDFELQDRAGRPHINIACSGFDPHNMSLEAQSEIRERLTELLASILGRTVMIENPEWLLEQLFRDELALERSIGFTGSFGAVGNVLGHAPKTRISSWGDRQAREYSLKRSKSWDADDARTRRLPNSNAGRSTHTPGQGEPPPELLDWGRAKHTQIQTVSLIWEPLWDAAKWCGTAFFVSLSQSSPPTLAPMFENSEAAKQIFAQWRSELGICDEEERLRVAIVRAIDTSNPYAYRVIIGANPNVGFLRPDVRYTVFVTRTHTMETSSNLNLDRFLQSYKAFGRYFLAPAVMRNGLPEPELIRDHHLIKRELHVREAWEIGRHDVDSAAIHDEDSPIIPAGQKNPPILELLRWKRELLFSSTKSRS